MSTLTAPSSLFSALERIAPFIGNTPLFPITKLFKHSKVKLYAKQEWLQFGGSVKSRAAYQILKDGIQNGELYEGKTILDATSGNTGIALATFAVQLGLKITLCLPENASDERKSILKALNVNLILTSPLESTDGAQREAWKLYSSDPDKYFYASQYTNESNWKAHYNGTAYELIRQTGGAITHFVSGLGTTGTFVGTGRRLAKLNSKIQLIALQPETAMHGLEGWKHMQTALVPQIYDNSVATHVNTVATQDAYDMVKRAAEMEGLLLSPSSAANLVGAIQVAEKLNKGVVTTILPDNSDKYAEVTNQIFN